MISNIKHKERERERNLAIQFSLLNIQQRRIQNSFQYLSKEIISLEVTIFPKIPILDV